MIRTARVAVGSSHRFAATDERYPGVVGYGGTPDEATRALEDKLPRRAPKPPSPGLLPLSPKHGIAARDLARREAALEAEERRAREERRKSEDAMDRAVLVGSIDSNRRRH